MAGTLDGCGHGEHLWHAGSSPRTLVSQNDSVTGAEPSAGDVAHGVGLVVEDARHADKTRDVQSRELHHRTLGSERTVEDSEATIGAERSVHGPHNRAVSLRRSERGEILSEGGPRNRECVAVEQSGLEQSAQYDWYAPDTVEVAHHETAAGS